MGWDWVGAAVEAVSGPAGGRTQAVPAGKFDRACVFLHCAVALHILFMRMCSLYFFCINILLCDVCFLRFAWWEDEPLQGSFGKMKWTGVLS